MDLHGLQCFQQNYPETFLHELVLTARNVPASFSRKIPGGCINEGLKTNSPVLVKYLPFPLDLLHFQMVVNDDDLLL